MYDEDIYLRALAEMSNSHFNEKEWLLNNFELYKLTLVWPPNMPPINRPNLIKGTLREKFNSTYRQVLSEFEYELNNKNRTIIIE
jgi:hypothetical protein